MAMHQLNIFILSFGALQGVLLGILMLRKRSYRTPYVFLLLYLFTLLVQVAMKIATKVWLMEEMRGVYFISYELPFLYGPLLYLFVTQVMDRRRKISPVDALHFFPFLYFATGDLLMMTIPNNELISRLFDFPASILLYAQLMSLSAYHLFCYQKLAQQTAPTDAWQMETLRWLKRQTTFSALVTGCIAFGLFFMYIYFPRYSDLRFLFGIITVYIYWVSYEAMRHPESLNLVVRPVLSAYQTVVPNGSLPAPTRKYHNSTLKSEDIEAILCALSRVMDGKQPYLSPDLNIDTLAAMAGTNRHNLSQAINERLQKNFYDYLNEYRVKAAEKILTDPAYGHLKIAAIAYDAGFNSLSTFNDVFKKMTGDTPSAFRKKESEKCERVRG